MFYFCKSALFALSVDIDRISTDTSYIDKDTSNHIRLSAGGFQYRNETFVSFSINGIYRFQKLAIGFNIPLNYTENYKIRDTDWDEWWDYLDIITLSWENKASTLYINTGSIKPLHYGNSTIISGYTNSIENPYTQRYGLKLAFNMDKLHGELFLNDLKELLNKKPSVFAATRLEFEASDRIKLGATLASDFNECQPLKDTDRDGYPDEFDYYPDDNDYVTEYDRICAFYPEEAINELILLGIIAPIRKEQLKSYNDFASISAIVGFDLSYSIMQNERFSLQILSDYTKIIGNGWGIGFPGLCFSYGNTNRLTFTSNYHFATSDFQYDYYSFDYHFQRLQFRDTGYYYYEKEVITKKDALSRINEKQNGYSIISGLVLKDIGSFKIGYREMFMGANSQKTIFVETDIKKKIYKNISFQFYSYYAQNNVAKLGKFNDSFNYLFNYTVCLIFNRLSIGYEQQFSSSPQINHISTDFRKTQLSLKYNFI